MFARHSATERQESLGRPFVITKGEVIPLLLETCPGISARWAEHLAGWEGSERGPFNDTSEIARYVVDSFAEVKTEEFGALFSLLERIIRDGDEDARGLAVVGVLESVQTISSHHAFGPEAFESWLGPLSRQAWADIDRLWSAGGGSLAGVVRYEQQVVAAPRRRWWQFWK